MEERDASEQRIANKPGDEEAREKGEWASTAQEGIVPAEQGGSDAPPELQGSDPELGGQPAGGGAAERLVGVLEASDEVTRELGGAPKIDLLNARLTGPGFGPRTKGRVGA